MRSSDTFAFACIILLAAPVAAFVGEIRPLGAQEALAAEPVVQQRGDASFYSDKYKGMTTANGETFSQNRLTAASRDLPLGTKAMVTNQANGKSVEVKITDRGPYVDGRVIDLSKMAARQIGLSEKRGITPVKVEARPSSQPTAALQEAVRRQAVAASTVTASAEN
ncbi:MAG: septal ring lytic transglycosylase RlpA family protein [Alphaproteobacteria bacterium]|nr:septal ring lytic transglycosylase RlpA family protein [Alphaproteobacteria bacterium]